MGGAVTPLLVKELKQFFTSLSRVAKAQGGKGLVLFLKEITIRTQQMFGGYYVPCAQVRVARTKSGIPRVFPRRWRRLIKSGHIAYMKLALTCASLYRDMMIPGTLKLSSITKPYSGDQEIIIEIIEFIPQFGLLFCSRYFKNWSLRDYMKGMFSHSLIFKSSPQSYGGTSTSVLSLVRSMGALSLQQIEDLKLLWALSADPNLPFYQTLPWMFTHLKVLDTFFRGLLPWYHNFTGKLGLKHEAAGKERVFAMVDPWTQLVLRPLHRALFKLLSKHSSIDGTFDQLKPLRRIQGSNKPLYSMDLSSATDRLPIAIQTPLIVNLLGLTVEEGNAWQRLLIDRAYMLPFNDRFSKSISTPNNRINSIHYAVGQPMGALSSWAMLALTHHLIVQFAARSITKGLYLFRDYAILGDDIVIFNTEVATNYQIVLDRLGMEIQLAKSILSPKGLGMEFAKRTFYLGKDVSPTPLKEFYASLMNIVAFAGYMKKYNLSLATGVRVAGFGYKVAGGLNKAWGKLNLKIRFLALLGSSVNDSLIQLVSRMTETVELRLLRLSLMQHISSEVLKLRNRIKSDRSRAESARIPLTNVKWPKEHPITVLSKTKAKARVEEKYRLIAEPFFMTSFEHYKALASILLKDLRHFVPTVSPFLPESHKIVVLIKQYLDIVSLKTEWSAAASPINMNKRSDSDENRDSQKLTTPKQFLEFMVMMDLVHRLRKVVKPTLPRQDLSVINEELISGFIPGRLLRPILRNITLKSFGLITRRVIISRIKHLGVYTALWGIASLFVGIQPVCVGLITIWGAYKVILGYILPWLSPTSPFGDYIGNAGLIILHAFECYLAGVIVACIWYYHIWWGALFLDLSAVFDGGMTWVQLCWDMILLSNRIFLDVASGIIPVAHTAGVFVLNSPSLFQFSVGAFGMWILINFISWLLGW